MVDAGGFGFITIFEGMLDALRGIHKERAVAAEPTKSTADFAAINDEEITFTYCTEFIASRKDKGTQCRSSALHPERYRRLARCGRG